MSKINKIELDKYLRSTFTEVDVDKKAFIILLNGKRVQVRNGKKIWGSSGAAKNAINNHMSNAHNNRRIYDNIEEDTTYEQQYEAHEKAEKAIKEWVQSNIKVISVGEYEATQAKLKQK